MTLPTIPDTARLTSYTISVASVGPYSVGFDLYADDDDASDAAIEVWLDGVQLAAETDFTVDSPSGDLDTIDRPITDARVTLVTASTGALKIVGHRRPRSIVSLINGQAIPASTFNRVVNDLLAMLREFHDLRSRLYMAVPGSAGGQTTVPSAGVSAFAATLLDDTTAAAMLSTLGISSFIQTLLNDADAATARTTLGIVSTVPVVSPQGRLTLTSGTAITTSDVTGATLCYYTPAVGNLVPIYDGAAFTATSFAELSNDSTATSTGKAGPAAVAASKVYFMLVWSDSGTIRLTRSPAWTSDTVVGTGAGTAEIELVGGVWVNKVAVTNGPGAQRGTVVGAIRSNASQQLTDSKLFRYVSNIYNATPRPMRATDTTDSWAYTTATWRQANATTANEINWLHALDGSPIEAEVIGAGANTAAAAYMIVSVGIDSTTTPVSGALNSLTYVQVTNQNVSCNSSYKGFAGQGKHRAVWLEQAQATGTATWLGDGGGTVIQTGISGWVMN